MKFSHITPIPHLQRTAGRDFYLTLAHLTEQSEEYNQFHIDQKSSNPDCIIIQDNSAFEMYKQNRDYLSPDQLIELGRKTNADYLVMTDYPNQPGNQTIEAAKYIMPKIQNAGFGTFFCPQSKIGDFDDLIDGFVWAAVTPGVDYIGLSILAIPNAYSVESGNKLQRFLSRVSFYDELSRVEIDGISFWDYCEQAGKKFHALGMVDGPKEISFAAKTQANIDTWDSSAAVWAGLNGIQFDRSPTGLVNGKYEAEVDFFNCPDWTDYATNNIMYLDSLVHEYNMGKL